MPVTELIGLLQLNFCQPATEPGQPRVRISIGAGHSRRALVADVQAQPDGCVSVLRPLPAFPRERR